MTNSPATDPVERRLGETLDVCFRQRPEWEQALYAERRAAIATDLSGLSRVVSDEDISGALSRSFDWLRFASAGGGASPTIQQYLRTCTPRRFTPMPEREKARRIREALEADPDAPYSVIATNLGVDYKCVAKRANFIGLTRRTGRTGCAKCNGCGKRMPAIMASDCHPDSVVLCASCDPAPQTLEPSPVDNRPLVDSDTSVIWWLSQADTMAIGDLLDETIPEYIRAEYASRRGRAGRGRLWIGSVLADVDIRYCVGPEDPAWDTPLGRYISRQCGGVVIRAADAKSVASLPGIITDARLVRAASH